MKQFVLDMIMFSMVPTKEYEFSRLGKKRIRELDFS